MNLPTKLIITGLLLGFASPTLLRAQNPAAPNLVLRPDVNGMKILNRAGTEKTAVIRWFVPQSTTPDKVTKHKIPANKEVVIPMGKTADGKSYTSGEILREE